MEKVLILEDSEERIYWFLETFKGKFDYYTTENPEVAIEYLKRTDFDYIFLDHDLLPEHYAQDTNCNQTTGLCVAEWLGNNKENNTNASVIIHSMNWNGARRMQQALNRDSQWCPFPELQKRMSIS